jgi:hypothetical protein
MSAITEIIRGVIAVAILAFFGRIAYWFWCWANMGFAAYFHCKTAMVELGYPPNTCPFPWSCVFLMVGMAIPIGIGIWLAFVILAAFR